MLSPVGQKHRERQQRFSEVATMLKHQGLNLRLVDLTESMKQYIKFGDLGNPKFDDESILLDEVLN